MADTLTAPASLQPPAPPPNALDTTPGADPTAAPAAVPTSAPVHPLDATIAEADRISGPLGASLIGAVAGAHIANQQANAQSQSDSSVASYDHDYNHDANGNVVHVPTPKTAQTPASSAPASRDPKQIMQDPNFLALPAADQQSVLSHIDPNFSALSPEDQQSVIAHLQSLPKTPADPQASVKQKYGLPAAADLSKPYLDPANKDVKDPQAFSRAYQEFNPPQDKSLLDKAGDVVSNILKPWEGAQAPRTVEELLSPFEMLAGEAAGTVLGPYLSKIRGLFSKAGTEASTAIPTAARTINPEDLIEREFVETPQGATPQHGTPVETPQPLDRATVDKLSGGKNLSTEAFNALKEHVGGPAGQEIEVGSSPKNILHKASAPVQKTLTETGLEMNKAIQDAPAFKTSTIADPDSTLLKDIEGVRDNLPLKLDDPLNKVVDVQMQAAYPALQSTDPAEALAYRRKLSGQIDWQKITNSPETTGEAKNLTQVKIYNALGEKLHTEIPKTAELDKTFQPNLELQSFLDKNGVARDAVEANAEHLSELNKGKNKLAVDAQNAQAKIDVREHNKTVAANRKLAGLDTPAAPTTGDIGSAIDDAASKFKVPAGEQDALRKLIQPSVSPGKIYGTNTNWFKALDTFDKLPTEAQAARFSDPTSVRGVLRTQATKQLRNAILKYGSATAAIGVVSHELGIDGAVLRALLHSGG